MMRLDKILADMGVGSRKETKEMIRRGEVAVNGVVLKDGGAKVDWQDEIKVKGAPLEFRRHFYYMLYKPAGVITATKDANKATVLELLSDVRRKDLFPVGRLDKDTEGLLLITNNGELAHRLLSPKYHVDKTYFARLDERITKVDMDAFAGGLVVDADFTAMPAKLVLPDPKVPKEVLVTIKEGKYHQIKRMFAAVGKQVLYLKRLSMGSLQLDESLEKGAYRELTGEEIKGLYTDAGLG